MEKRNGQITTGYNSTYPKGGVSCSKDNFVVKESLYLHKDLWSEFQIQTAPKI
jgi:hypothetical protein